MKVLEVALVRLVAVKLMVAPVTAAALVAVRPEKVATPEMAFTTVVPPSVQVPDPTAAVTLALLPVTVLLYWSWIVMTGWVARAAPLLAGAAGWVVTDSLVAAPGLMVWESEVVAA